MNGFFALEDGNKNIEKKKVYEVAMSSFKVTTPTVSKFRFSANDWFLFGGKSHLEKCKRGW